MINKELEEFIRLVARDELSKLLKLKPFHGPPYDTEQDVIRSCRIKKLGKDRRKRRAGNLIRTAYKLGWISKMEGKYFHHPDYKRAFYGCFVSLVEHAKLSKKSAICPDCYDYWPDIRKKYTFFRRQGMISSGGLLTRKWHCVFGKPVTLLV